MTIIELRPNYVDNALPLGAPYEEVPFADYDPRLAEARAELRGIRIGQRDSYQRYTEGVIHALCCVIVGAMLVVILTWWFGGAR